MADTLNNGTLSPYPPNPSANTQLVENLNLADLLLERGTTGLRQAGGWVKEEYLRELAGPNGMRVYREMRDNSGVVGSCLFAIEMLMRKVTWRVQPADDSLLAAEYADFVDGMLFRDLDVPWSMLLSDILSMLPFGWSWFELILKQRNGPQPVQQLRGIPYMPSQFDDGMFGFGRIAIRAQDTLLRWQFDPAGQLMGMHQLDPWLGRQAYLPYEKCLLFRPSSWKNSPEGRSILRNAYRSWYLAKHLENTEAIGAERDLAGLPVMYVPPQWMAATASKDEQAQLDLMKKIVRNVRRDEQAGLVLPSIYDLDGHQLIKFELLASAGARALNTNEMIQRHELRIAQSMLADLIFLGHEAVGSFALASSKTNILSMALGGYLMSIADVFNRRAIPLIWRVNALPDDLMPTLVHGDVESVDLKELGQFIKDYAQAGFNVEDLDNHIRMLVQFPEREEGIPVMAPQPVMGIDGEDASAETGDEARVTKRRMVVPMSRPRWRGYQTLITKRAA